MKWVKEHLEIIIVVVAILLCIFLICKNYKDPCFFRADIIDILTILIGSIFVIYFSERMTDRRRRNDCIEHIVEEIEQYILDDNNYKINKSTFIKHQSCANRIKYLRDASFTDIKDDIEYIQRHFEEIRTLYSNHSNSEEELEAIRVDIDRHRANINDKCSKIRIGLYSNALRNRSRNRMNI